jgi:large-conductance mechanosensitive channel
VLGWLVGDVGIAVGWLVGLAEGAIVTSFLTWLLLCSATSMLPAVSLHIPVGRFIVAFLESPPSPVLPAVE